MIISKNHRPGFRITLTFAPIGYWSWGYPKSDTLPSLNKAIGFNDIGIQLLNTQVPFKFVG